MFLFVAICCYLYVFFTSSFFCFDPFSFAFLVQAPLSELATYFVVDTNILLHHFEVLAQFVDDVERLTLPVIVIVPGAVVHELDGWV